MLLLGNAGFHGLQIAGNFCLQPSPFSGGGIAYRFHIIACRLDVSVYFFDRGGGGGTRLLPARHDFVMRFLLSGRDSVLGMLGMGRQVGKWFREFGHRRLLMMTPVPESFTVKIEGMCCISIVIPGTIAG